MSGLEGLTVCITAFKRPERLAAAIASVAAAGITNITVSRGDEYGGDIGLNNAWMVAAYRAKTKRVLLLHDDDTLHPDFGRVYGEIIAPCLDKRDAGFASWDAEIKYDDGRTEACPYWQGVSPLVMPAKHLQEHLDNCLTHSPVVSVLNRAVLIRACKEAGETLTTNDSFDGTGVLLGTELLVYYRHINTFKRWLHVPQVLSYYGSHEGSGTVRAQAAGQTERLAKGYNLARRQAMAMPPIPTPRLLLVHSVYTPKDPIIAEKQRIAQESWRWHFNNGDVIDLPFAAPKMPTAHEVFDHACQFALPEDIIVYANADAGLTTRAVELIVEGIRRGRGVTSCGNRTVDPPEPGRLYKTLANRRAPGGTEVIAMTPAWWAAHREKMPPMFIGREAWDTVFNALAEDWADGPGDVITEPDEWLSSRAHTDGVCWHQPHFSEWQLDRLGRHHGEISETQRHNRDAARAFFSSRQDLKLLSMLK